MKVLMEETLGTGVDVILDMVAGDYIPRDIELAATEGSIVIIAFLGGWTAEVDLRPLMLKRLTLTGSTLRPQSVATKGAIAAALQQKVWPLLESGRIEPVIYETFPLEKASEAHALMESNKHIGKIVITME